MKTKNIKNIALIGTLAFASLLPVSCKKVLDVAPFNSFTDVSAFTSPQRVELAMNGVYDAAQSGFYAGGQVRGYPFGAAFIEQGDMRGEDMYNQALFYQITYEATYNNTTANNVFMFHTLYSLINKANLAIEGVRDAASKNIISTAIANEYEAEARFLRALAHHELLIHFARPYADGNGTKTGIIYRTTGIDNDAKLEAAKSQLRTTVADNYNKLIDDLNFAETNLPGPQPTGKRTYRAGKAAAIALKMRVYQHMGNWTSVISEGNKLVPSGSGPYVSPIGGWTLTATPDGPFSNNLSSESIFSIRNDAVDNPGVNGALASMLGNPTLGGRGLVRVSPIIFNRTEWLCDDRRRGSTMINQDARSLYTNKYRDISNRSDAAPVIRYAEVLLMLAEAEARNAAAVSSRALDLLNAVRNRSLASPGTQAYTLVTLNSKNALIRAILMERRIEFLGEGKRWSDIHRLALDATFGTGGIPQKIVFGNQTALTDYNCNGTPTLTLAVPFIPYSDNRFIWPIPLDETQQNPNYAQNPGY